MSGPATEMRDSHRLFLQAFMSRGMLASNEVQDMFKEACIRFGGNDSSLSILVTYARTVDILAVYIYIFFVFLQP